MLPPLRVLAALALAASVSSCFLMRPMIQPPEPWTTESGLVIYDMVELEGEPVVPGDEVSVHYTASLHNGQVFDTSRERGMPISYVAGAGQVPAGFDEGVLGMVPGAVRRVLVPPHLAYGEAGIEGIVPPGATIVFDIELLL